MVVGALAGCTPHAPAPIVTPVTHDPRFDWFEYAGHDPVFDTLARDGDAYTNPILQGFYPDPSITRVGPSLSLSCS